MMFRLKVFFRVVHASTYTYRQVMYFPPNERNGVTVEFRIGYCLQTPDSDAFR